MSIEIPEKKMGQVSRQLEVDSNEMVKRWQQLRIVSSRNGKYYESTVVGQLAHKEQAYLFEGVQAIWLLSSIVTLFIAARIGVKLVAVEAGTPLARLVIDLTDVLLWPFAGATETLTTAHISVLELSALNAIIIYPFAAWCLVKLLQSYFTSHAK